MSELDPPQHWDAPRARDEARGAAASGFRRPVLLSRPVAPVVSFDRRELREIMNLYGRMVAAGEWRDYAIDFTPDHAVFSVFRRACETPLYQIRKDPKLARRQGAYSILAVGGHVLKRGQELAGVLAVLERRPRLVVG